MAITCPVCGNESPSYKGYAIHHSRADHDGHALVTLVGRGRLVELYWSMGYEEIAEELGVGSTTVFNVFEEMDVPAKTEANRLEYRYGVPLPWLLDTLHNTLEKSVNQMSKELGVSRVWIDRHMLEHEIPKRGRSEAERLKWQQMTEEERRKQVAAAHEKTRKLAELGEDSLSKLWEEDPRGMREQAQRVAALGTPAREVNGMAGVTGQDHPNWRGGKSVYDAVKKQLPGDGWRQLKIEAKRRDGYYCQSCGAMGCKLDSHHVVPVMAGGTNGYWNLMTLCESCHRKAEMFVRQYPEFDPILTE